MIRPNLVVALGALVVLGLLSGCREAPAPSDEAAPAPRDISTSVWSVDLIRTLPGQQAEYLRNIEANWAGARRIAQDRQVVLSYRALAAPPDSARGWDVLLMTEYADSTTWADREEIFASIFASPEYVRVPTARPSSELRAFVAGGVVMEARVDVPADRSDP